MILANLCMAIGTGTCSSPGRAAKSTCSFLDGLYTSGSCCGLGIVGRLRRACCMRLMSMKTNVKGSRNYWYIIDCNIFASYLRKTRLPRFVQLAMINLSQGSRQVPCRLCPVPNAYRRYGVDVCSLGALQTIFVCQVCSRSREEVGKG